MNVNRKKDPWVTVEVSDNHNNKAGELASLS